MFDDLLSASLLVGVAGVLGAAVTGFASAPPEPPPPAVSSASRAIPPGAGIAPRTAATPAMPIYELPRVVVTGNRLRDGDMLADGRDPARPSGGPR